MQCPFCKETIIDGAVVCRFCGKKQPLTGEDKKARALSRGTIVFFSIAALIGILLVWSKMDAEHEMALLQAAATCNGTMTADQIETSAKAAAKDSGMSEVEAFHAAEILACPSMGNSK